MGRDVEVCVNILNQQMLTYLPKLLPEYFTGWVLVSYTKVVEVVSLNFENVKLFFDKLSCHIFCKCIMIFFGSDCLKAVLLLVG